MTFFNISFPRSLIHLVVGRREEKNIYFNLVVTSPWNTYLGFWMNDKCKEVLVMFAIFINSLLG